MKCVVEFPSKTLDAIKNQLRDMYNLCWRERNEPIQSEAANANCKCWEDQMANCPIGTVPHHGRLIDADELRQEWLDADNVTYEVNDVLNSIDYAPTIIEAEEG